MTSLTARPPRPGPSLFARPVCQLTCAPSVGPRHAAVLSSEDGPSLHCLGLAPALKSRSLVRLLFPE